MPDIPELRQQRGVPKGQLSRLERWLETHHDAASFYEVETRLNYLETVVANFERIQSDLERLDPAESDREDRAEFEDKMFAIKATLLEMKNVTAADTTIGDTTGPSNLSIEVCSTPDLPPIQIPEFRGDYFEYPGFMDAFRTLVHDNKSRNMNDIKRFALLKSACKEKALDTIKDLMMTAANYPVALDLLAKRFDKKRLTAESLIKKMWNIPKASSVSSLRKLSDEVNTHLRALRLIATEEEVSDGILIYLCLTKCDEKTIVKWEQLSSNHDTLPKWSEFSDWLQKKCVELECAEYAAKNFQPKASSSMIKSHTTRSSKSPSKTTFTATASSSKTSSNNSCCVCKGSCSSIESCSTFLAKDPRERYTLARNLRLCVRCLSMDHKQCDAKCDLCNKLHHTKLHFFKKTNTDPLASNVCSNNEAHMNLTPRSKSERLTKVVNTYTLLGTAVINVQAGDGSFIKLRALLDSGSQSHFITERARKLLGVDTVKSSMQIVGINGPPKSMSRASFLRLASTSEEFTDEILAIVHPNFNQLHPSSPLNTVNWTFPDYVVLADPSFSIPAPVDLILNADYAYRVLKPNRIDLGKGKPLLQDTKFGYIVVGDTHAASSSCTFNSLSASASPSLEAMVERFWVQEEVPGPAKLLSESEKVCEQHFVQTFERKRDGRFVVRLPFQKSPSVLGQSRHIAVKRLLNMERKLLRDEKYAKDYNQFMVEYESLRHMSEISPPPQDVPHYYLPHFGVINEDSTTTKLRVVFDGSCATDSGVSLNDVLTVGPTIQPDLFSHLIGFRCHAIAISADISKMYRQVEVHPDDQMFQLIVWRQPNEQKIRTFKLNTVTYGTSSAPFAAIRCLSQLAKEASDLPLGAEAVLNHFYVDDMLHGADSVADALKTSMKQKLYLHVVSSF